MKTLICKKLFLILLVLLPATSLTYAQQQLVDSSWSGYIRLTDYLIPFWKSDTVYDEITQAIQEDRRRTGTLLFPAAKIISIKSADQQKIFIRKKDWVLNGGKIVIPPKSAIPYFTAEDLLFTTEKPGLSMRSSEPAHFIPWSESTFFRSKQIAVTYIPNTGARWHGPVPFFADKILPNTISRLQHRKIIKVLFYGNSIETGYNTSGFQHQSPFMPSWPELIVYALERAYRTRVDFSNPSVPGKMAEWGKENVSGLVIPEKPDLIIIGFGMNDGSAQVSPAVYKENIEGIINPVLAQNPEAEFVLIAPMLANPLAIQHGIQDQYKAVLDQLQRKGIVVADLTGVHAELLKHKRYQDMTGNNVNHPNDYLARWYAQFIAGFFINSAESASGR